MSKFRPGDLVPNRMPAERKVAEQELPKTLLADYDYLKRLLFKKEKVEKLNSMSKWKLKDFKGMKKKAYIKEVQMSNDKILKVAEKTALEKNEVATDRFPLLHCRRKIKKFFIWWQLISYEIIKSPAFENLSILVILVNSIVMVFDEPGREQAAALKMADYVFTGIYTVEMLLKIAGMGFVWDQGSYLRDSWNILDFIIVVFSYVPILLDATAEPASPIDTEVGVQADTQSSVGFNSLRTFRVLRPLKTISSVQGLKVIMSALFAAVPLLADTLMILLFFFFIFSIAGS